MAGGMRCTRKLKQWMVQQVDSEKYPGLVWEDRKLGMFRIPWKHAGKQDYRHDEDAAIFKAWAKFKGKYKDGDKVDPATWKTRLRCALNKSSEFQEVPQRSQLDISEPYKVYKILEDSVEKKKSPSPIPLSSVKVESSESVGTERSQPSSPSPQLETTEQAGSDIPSIDSQQMESDSSCDPSSGSEMSTQEEGLGEIASLEWSLTPSTEVPNNYTISIISSMAPSLPEKGPNSMFVSFCYGGVQVGSEVTRHGCKISSSAPPSCSDDSFGSQAMEKLRFPPTGAIASPEKRRATEELLTFLERGVMLDSNTNGIFVQRLCQGRVFWTGPCAPQPNQPNKLEREKVAKLFDRKKFEQDLELYQTMGGVIPQYQVTLCFGEELTETDSPTDKLITVQIYQMAAKQLLDREVELQTTSLILSQLSPENFSDRVTHALREASSSLYGIS
ncbi:interferon regulatory factor 8-like isoform X2 [Carcharodon carcharias]|uniref:interferon regulatory factor 8-like isoform X2 n=1 Tax=Carcharodon carcharias TaxID=13397 RepID=UPI001B7F42F4|nr:interferon regulatory factor 8-like isoform X2 [Carcharodon carcharias]